MTVLTSQPEAPASQVNSSDYYIWDEPEKSVSVHLNYQTMERLQKEILQALDSNDEGGVEIGGILLGRREHVADRVNTFIEEFVPVPCEYLKGSAYSLSAGSARKFETALKRRHSEATSSSSVLGFFRSHLRDDVFLTTADVTLIQTLFRDPDSLALLIKTLPSRGCTAAFFFWEDGRIQSEGAYNEVPLVPVQFGPATPREKQTVESPKPAQTPARVRLPRVAPKTAVGIAAAAITLGALGLWLKWGTQNPTTSSGADVLALHVQRSSDRLAVTWNRKSPEVASANRAVLAIRDGSAQKEFSLNQAQIRTGVVTYKPDNQDVYFYLEVYRGRTQVAKDTLHVFLENGPRYAAAQPSNSLSQAKGAPAPAGSTVAVVNQANVRQTNIKQENLKQETPTRTEHLAFNSGEIATTPLSPPIFKPPPSNRTAAPPALAVPADAGESSLSLSPVSPKIEGAGLPAFLTQSPARIDQPAPAQNGAPPVTTTVSQPQSGAPGAPRVNTYVPPQVLRRVSPHVSQDLRSKIQSDVEVDVTVRIDAKGNVTDAQVTSTKGGMAGFVRNDAINAARSFQFSPARENGHNIPSEMTVAFQFRP